MPASPSIDPATRIVALTSGTACPPTKMIIGSASGTATVVDCNGNSISSFPITGGEQHVSITKATFSTISIWGLY